MGNVGNTGNVGNLGNVDNTGRGVARPNLMVGHTFL